MQREEFRREPGDIDFKHVRVFGTVFSSSASRCAPAFRTTSFELKCSTPPRLQWDSNRWTDHPSYELLFPDSFADFGRWLNLWAESAQALEGADQPYIQRTFVTAKTISQHLFRLHDNATASVRTSARAARHPQTQAH